MYVIQSELPAPVLAWRSSGVRRERIALLSARRTLRQAVEMGSSVMLSNTTGERHVTDYRPPTIIDTGPKSRNPGRGCGSKPHSMFIHWVSLAAPTGRNDAAKIDEGSNIPLKPCRLTFARELSTMLNIGDYTLWNDMDRESRMHLISLFLYELGPELLGRRCSK